MLQKSIIFIGFLTVVNFLSLSVVGKIIIAKEFKELPEFCFECTSIEDGDVCELQIVDIDTLFPKCPSSGTCYTYLENGLVQRGCEDPTNGAGCFPPNCLQCIEQDNCNSEAFEKELRKCIVCSSSTQPECAIETPVPTTFEQECTEYEDVCVTEIVGMHTERECRKDISTCNAPLCDHCYDKANCNNGLFPIDRPKCFSCDGIGCFSEPSATQLKICKNYDDPETCYVNVVDETNAYRGCKSDDDYTERCSGQYCKDDYKPGTNNVDGNQKYYCYKCNSDEDCGVEDCESCSDEATKIEECEILLGRDDDCFFFDDGEKFSRGCISDAPNCESDPNCSRTFGPLSNGKTNLEKCVVCESTVGGDEFCKTDPSVFPIPDCFADEDPLKTGCYLKIIGDVYKRGCAIELTAAEYAECSDVNNQLCKICHEDECNKKTDFQSCYKCSGAGCETGGDEINTTICSDYLDECTTYVVDGGETVRGCRGELNPEEDNVICPSDTCYYCPASKCNNAVFPADRTKCYACSVNDRARCFNEQTDETNLKVCENYITNDKCFTVVKDKNKAARGCVSDQNEMCTDDEHCLDQYESERNSESGDTIGQCWKCSSVGENAIPDCNNILDEKENCPALLGIGPECYYYNDGLLITRGCLANADSDIATKCITGDENCETTVGNLSNDNTDYVYCVSCDSEDPDDEDKCKDEKSLNEIAPEICSFSDEDKNFCYLRVDGAGKTKRGCFNDVVDLIDLAECTNENSNICKKCSEYGCNRKATFQKCYVCDSSVTNQEECAVAATGIESKPCQKYMDNCRNYVALGGKTERGCSSDINDVTCTTNSPQCKDCLENDCNDGLFPKNRLTCHQCNAENINCNDISEEAEHEQVCFNYQLHESCYSARTEDNKIKRGCLTDADAECRINENCKVCTENGCNNDPVSTPQTIKCIKCETTNAQCAWEFDKLSAQKCTAPILLGEDQWCYRYKTADNKVQRGCVLDEPNVCADDENVEDSCQKCNDADGCNFRYVVNSKCKVCTSETEKKCKDNAKELGNTECTTGQLYDHRGCFTRTIDGVTIRGCFANLSAEDMETCNNTSNKSCEKCLPDGCNSSATTIQFLLITLITTVFHFFNNVFNFL